MAKKFNGTSQALKSAGTLDLTGYTQLTVAFWLWFDGPFGDGSNKLLLESNSTANGVQNAININLTPSGLTGTSPFFRITADASSNNNGVTLVTTPTANAWHHYVACFDRNAGAQQITHVYVDGVDQALRQELTNTTSGSFGNFTWNWMSRDSASLWANGRLDEAALWAGTLLSGAEAAALARGQAAPPDLQTDHLFAWWPLDEPTGGRAADRNPVRGPRYPLNNTGGAPLTGPAPRVKAPTEPKRRYWLVGSAGGSGVNGSLASTLGAATAAGAGTVAVAGTAAPTLAAATVSAAGTVAVAGSLSSTLGAATLAGTGTVAVAATLSATLGAATVAGTGAVAVTGALAVTLGAMTGSGTATDPVVGTTAGQLGAATVAGTGTVAVTGTLAVTLGAATLAASGGSGTLANLSVTLGAATAAAAGTVTVTATASATLGALAAAGTGAVSVSAALSVALDAATCAGAGTVAGGGGVVVPDAGDVLFGVVYSSGSLPTAAQVRAGIVYG